MSEWFLSPQEEEIIAKCLGFSIQDGDLLSLDEETIAENLLKEFNV